MRIITFGRDHNNTVVLNDLQVSRKHCQITQYDNGQFSIVDLGSSNGTYVNGIRISRAIILNWSDYVRIGNTQLNWHSYFICKTATSKKPILPIMVGIITTILLVVGVSLYLFNISEYDNTNVYSTSLNETSCNSSYHLLNDAKNNTLSQTDITDFTPSISSQMPDIDRIQDDLIGRRISEQPNGYHHKNWYWEIESGEIRDLVIRNKIQTQNECLYELRFIVQDVAKQGSSHEMFVNITYILRDNKYWDVEFVESKQVNIVKTGKYNNCITSQRKGHNGEYYVEFVNYSDIDLVVGGAVSYQYSNETRHFNSIVKANSTSSVGGIFLGSIENYTIHFIERP